jgi:hypothetical protein
MTKALSIANLEQKKSKLLQFEDIWMDAFGLPEYRGAWLIWGNPANGKSVFAAMIAKYLSKFGLVEYDSLEMGISVALKRTLKIAGITSGDRIRILDKVKITDLVERLKKPSSAWAIIIDSFQYSGLNANSYKELRALFPNKLFIFISHAEGKHPAGRPAKTVRYDVDIKIWVEGFRAFPESRFGGGEPITIWNDGAEKYWNKNEKNNTDE